MSKESEFVPPVSAVLTSVANHIPFRCSKENKAFVECKKKDKNPQTCLAEGERLTHCVIDLLKEAREKAPEELKKYTHCLDYYSNKFTKCRKEQKEFEAAFPPGPAP
eukprot:jgi/Botrbrau1/12954/Bobra.154_2s0014.1